MRRLYFVFLMLLYSVVKSQCVIDSTQTVVGIYPAIPPNPVVGQFYNQDLTFVMPDETLGLAVTNVQLVSVGGLVPGMNWACNSPLPNCEYFPNQSIWGCVNINGIASQAGLYIVNINLVATIQVIGQQNFTIPLWVLIEPGILNNNGFDIQPDSACANSTVSIQNLTPGHFSYNWDFDNGQTSALEQPGTTTYQQGGVHYITQEIVPHPGVTYHLTGISINSLPNAYADGIFNDVPDLYLKLRDTSGLSFINKGDTILSNQNAPAFFAIDSLLLNNEIYRLEVWDDDPLFGAPDDSLGQITFYGWGSSGSGTCTLPGVSGTLNVSYTLLTLPIDPVVNIDSIYIYTPLLPVIVQSNDTLYAEPEGYQYQWFLNGNMFSSSSYIVLSQSGLYHVAVTDSNNCIAYSDTTLFTSLPSISSTPALSFEVMVNAGLLTLSISTLNDETIKIILEDITGKRIVSDFITHHAGTGNYSFALQQAKGIYMVKLETGNTFYTRKIVIR